MSRKPKPSPTRLTEFIRTKRVTARMQDCPVCQLPKAVREQLAQARALKVPREVVLEWLNTEVGTPITAAELQTHRLGLHDTRYAAA